MPAYEVRFSSRLRGPISSGRIHRHVDDYEADVAKELADETEYQLLTRFGQVLRNPTGYYTSRIQSTRISHNQYDVHDNDVVYGPWLEGTGSRNSPVTIFPGYGTFQYVGELMQIKRSGIARRVLRQHRSRGRLT